MVIYTYVHDVATPLDIALELCRVVFNVMVNIVDTRWWTNIDILDVCT